MWYANCSQIAEFVKAKDAAEIVGANEQGFALRAKDRERGNAAVTLRSVKPRIRRKGSLDWTEGAFKRGHWIFNGVQPGEYDFG
jgi:hypothetical protein